MGWTLVGHWRLPSSYEMMHLKKEDADGLPSHWRRKFIPKMWYFLVNAGAVFFLPFLSLYWRNTLGYTTPQIGLLQALRPWTSAASGAGTATLRSSARWQSRRPLTPRRRPPPQATCWRRWPTCGTSTT
jgi:hypothetical protein